MEIGALEISALKIGVSQAAPLLQSQNSM